MNTMIWFCGAQGFRFFLCFCTKFFLGEQAVNRLLLGLLRQEHGVDVRENTTGRDRDRAEELGEFLVVADRKLDVARHDAALLVVAGRVASEFKNFSREVLEHRGEVHRGTGADAGGVLASLQVAGNTAHRELQARLGGSAHGLLAGLTLSSSRHCRVVFALWNDANRRARARSGARR